MWTWFLNLTGLYCNGWEMLKWVLTVSCWIKDYGSSLLHVRAVLWRVWPRNLAAGQTHSIQSTVSHSSTSLFILAYDLLLVLPHLSQNSHLFPCSPCLASHLPAISFVTIRFKTIMSYKTGILNVYLYYLVLIVYREYVSGWVVPLLIMPHPKPLRCQINLSLPIITEWMQMGTSQASSQY